MNNNSGINYPYIFNLTPHSSMCYEFIKDNFKLGKHVLIIPHIIKHKEESEVIIWRCNWGNVCESECCYTLKKYSNRVKDFAFLPPQGNKAVLNVNRKSN